MNTAVSNPWGILTQIATRRAERERPPVPQAIPAGMTRTEAIRDSCEGYFGCNPDGRESYYTVDDQPIEHHHVTGWAEMPEGTAP